jgi:hypothetical protein
MMDDYSEWRQVEFENSNEFKLMYNKLIHLENTNRHSERDALMKEISRIKSEN